MVLGPIGVAEAGASFLMAAVVLAAFWVACGSGGSGTGTQDPLARFAGTRTESCATISGLTALYWDYMNGIIRVDYPETIRQVPFNIGGWVINPVQPLYSLVYPEGWTGQFLVDPGIQQTGLHVFRQDGHALWHRRNETFPGLFASGAVADAVVQEFQTVMAPGSASRSCAAPTPCRAIHFRRVGSRCGSSAATRPTSACRPRTHGRHDLVHPGGLGTHDRVRRLPLLRGVPALGADGPGWRQL